LIGYSFPEERVNSAKFPPPNSGDLSNVAGAHLLWQAARLTLREGATPLRSLGRVSIRPRTYQFVPLLMALPANPKASRNATAFKPLRPQASLRALPGFCSMPDSAILSCTLDPE
jgi:hypothetical protein